MAVQLVQWCLDSVDPVAIHPRLCGVFCQRVPVLLEPSRVLEHQWLETDELLDVSFTGVVSDCRVRASSEVRASNL